MRWKIWANPEPNEGLIRAVKICQLLVNSSSSPELGEGGGTLLAGAFGPAPRVLFLSLFLVFSFLECEYKLYGGAWSLFTPGANSPQLKSRGAEENREMEPPESEGNQEGWWRGRYRGPGGGVRIFNIEFAFFFFNVETFRHKPAPVFKTLKHL